MEIWWNPDRTIWKPRTQIPWDTSETAFIKPRGNGRNIVGQHLPTLLDVTCPVRLHTLLHVVGKCCTKFEPVRLLSQHLSTFLLFHDRRSVAQQCWIRLHSSSLTAHPKLLVPRTRITRGLQSVMGCIFSIIHCSSQHWWKLLHPFASVRNLVTEKQWKVQLK